MQRLRKPIAGGLPTTRSRVTNGTQLLIGVDGRSPAARRFRDLVRAYEQDYHITSEADRSLVRLAAMLALKGEQSQAALVRGEPVDAGEITRLAGQQRRVLADLRRKGEAASPTLISIHEHLARSAAEREPDEGED